VVWPRSVQSEIFAERHGPQNPLPPPFQFSAVSRRHRVGRISTEPRIAEVTGSPNGSRGRLPHRKMPLLMELENSFDFGFYNYAAPAALK